MTSRHQGSMLGEDSPVNTVGARLAMYAALAGAAGASVSLALRRHNRKSILDDISDKATPDPISDDPVTPHRMTASAKYPSLRNTSAAETWHEAGEQRRGGASVKANWPSPGSRGNPDLP